MDTFYTVVEFLWKQIQKNEWIFTIGFAALAVYWMRKALGISPISAMKALLSEARSFASLNFSVGAINFAGIIVLFVFGLAVLAAAQAQYIYRALDEYVGTEQASTFKEASTPESMFYGILLFAILSIWAVSRDRRD